MAFSSRTSVSVVACVLLLAAISFSEAAEVIVGGKTDAWKVPTSQSDSLNTWAQAARFKIGDTLVWKYDSKKDSMLQVTKEAYETCNTTAPLEAHNDGDTKVKLNRSGPHYFISGTNGNCEKGEKMIVVVLSAKHFITSPAPSPAGFLEGPAVAPTSGHNGVPRLQQGGISLVLGSALLGYVLMYGKKDF